jgi:cell division protein FtsQ
VRAAVAARVAGLADALALWRGAQRGRVRVRMRIGVGGRSSRWRLLLVLAIAALVLFGCWMWFRDSSLVAVTKVTITGAAGPAAAEIDSALRSTAHGMTTLDFDSSRLRAAVAGYPEVTSLRVSSSFPHSLTIEVIEKAPVAAIVLGSRRLAVTADGTVLERASTTGLPSVVASIPPIGGRLADPAVAAAISVLAGAPQALRTRIIDAVPDPRGVRVELRAGPELVFGPPLRVEAKWAAITRVLADPAAAGAIYIDVRIPERPVAGGRGSVSAAAGASGGSQSSSAAAQSSPTSSSSASGAQTPTTPTTSAGSSQSPSAGSQTSTGSSLSAAGAQNGTAGAQTTTNSQSTSGSSQAAGGGAQGGGGSTTGSGAAAAGGGAAGG